MHPRAFCLLWQIRAAGIIYVPTHKAFCPEEIQKGIGWLSVTCWLNVTSKTNTLFLSPVPLNVIITGWEVALHKALYGSLVAFIPPRRSMLSKYSKTNPEFDEFFCNRLITLYAHKRTHILRARNTYTKIGFKRCLQILKMFLECFKI